MTPALIGLLFAVIAQAPAATPAPRYERPIAIAAPGPQRLAVDTALLSGSAPFTVISGGGDRRRLMAVNGLSDLRLYAADGTEVPYLLVSPPVREAQWVRARVQPIAPTEKTSGFEADIGTSLPVNAIDIGRVADNFMKRFSLEASPDREHWTQVVPEGTLFDLPEQRLRETVAAFSGGPYRYVRLTWDDTHSARVPLPTAVYVRLVTGDEPRPPLRAAARFELRPSEPGRSRYHVTLPAAHLPVVALQLVAGGAYVFRNVEVTESRLGAWQAAPATIGRGLLVRDQSNYGGLVLRVAIQPPSEAELDVLVDDGNNPPLDLQAVIVEFAELPWIYFEATGPIVARYGDPRLRAPSYDLEAVRASLRLDALPEAHWASTTTRSLTPPSLPTPDASTLTGASLDVSSFRYARGIASGPAGLIGLPLDAAVLAHSAGPLGEFSDVRVVDATGHQVPRLVEHRPEPLLVPLRAEAFAPKAVELQPKAGVNRSIYRMALPYPALPDAQIVIGSSARVFSRRVQIGFERPPDRGHRDPWFMSAGTADWSHKEGTAALTLPIRSPSRDTTDLLLVVDEGDNAPLPISSVQLVLPSYRLRFVRPSGEIRLVYGASVAPPRYDLALLAPTVLGTAVADATMAAESPTPVAQATAQIISPKAFWIILVAAVVALLGILAALLRRGQV